MQTQTPSRNNYFHSAQSLFSPLTAETGSSLGLGGRKMEKEKLQTLWK